MVCRARACLTRTTTSATDAYDKENGTTAVVMTLLMLQTIKRTIMTRRAIPTSDQVLISWLADIIVNLTFEL